MTGSNTLRRTVSGIAKPTQARGEPNSRDSIECIRARETERVLRKLDFSQEQAEAVERLSRSLVDQLVCGPIAGTAAIIEATSKPAAGGEA